MNCSNGGSVGADADDDDDDEDDAMVRFGLVSGRFGEWRLFAFWSFVGFGQSAVGSVSVDGFL